MDAPPSFASQPSCPMAQFGGDITRGSPIAAVLGRKSLPPDFPNTLEAVLWAEWYGLFTSTPNLRAVEQTSLRPLGGMTGAVGASEFPDQTGRILRVLAQVLLNQNTRTVYVLLFTGPASTFDQQRALIDQMCASLQILG